MSELQVGQRVRYVGPDTEFIKQGDVGIYQGRLWGNPWVEIDGATHSLAPDHVEAVDRPAPPPCESCARLRAENARLRKAYELWKAGLHSAVESLEKTCSNLAAVDPAADSIG